MRTKYREDFPTLAEGYAMDGMIDSEIAAKLGISNGSFYEYQRRYPEFAEALKRGKEPVDIEVTKALLKSALGYEVEETQQEIRIIGEKEYKTIRKVKKRIPGSNTAQIFWLKNRRGWSDRQQLDLGGDIEIVVTVEHHGKDENKGG